MDSLLKEVKIRLSKLLARLQAMCAPDEEGKPQPAADTFADTDTSKDLATLFDDDGKLKPTSSPTEIKDEEHWWCFPGREAVDTPVIEALEPEFVTQELNRKIDNDEFPVIEIPTNVMRTLQLLNNPNFDYGEVSSLVNHSPAMAGEFIRVINSSMFSRGVPISDLKLALPRLGRDNIKALLYMYSSKMCFVKDPLFNELAISIVDHSYAVGLIASYLSQRFYPDPDGAFLAGLLHDIGKLGILKAISDNFTLPAGTSFKMTDEVFDNIFPHLHERAGKFLAGSWKVNETVICAIEHHHDFMETPFDENDQLGLHLSCIVNISDIMARMLGYGRSLGPTNIFSEASTIDLAMEKDMETIKFLEEIPRILSFKTPPSASDSEKDAAHAKGKAGKR